VAALAGFGAGADHFGFAVLVEMAQLFGITLVIHGAPRPLSLSSNMA
jgi:hypothetical protein